jgi:hypothetical protein
MIEQVNMGSSNTGPLVVTALKASELGRRAPRRG